MKIRNKGFTLVELLVTIVILGIITGISIPLIRNVRESQQRKQYETYRNSLSYASKVYVGSFSEDLFGHDEIGCATITYNQLKSKNLIKDIPISGVSCASNDTYVRIVKFEDQYSYLPKITCGVSQDDGTISKDVEIPEGNVDSDLCGLNVDTKIDIIFNPESSHTPDVQRKNIKVDFKSPTGIHSDPIIYWAFSESEDFSSIIGEWKKLDLDVLSKKKQKTQILQGNDIILTKEFITPKNYNGRLYLVLKIDRLEDLGGKNWTNTDTDIVSGGYYVVDNESPQFNDSEITYSEPVNRKVTPTLKFKATDNLTSESNLRMCISEDTSTDNCSKNINDIKKKRNGWVSYNKNKVLPVMNNANNGENHNIFISIADQAGNYTTQQFVYYRSLVNYSITYKLDKGSYGASHPSRAVFDEKFTVNYPTKKIKIIFENKISGVSIDYSSSTVSKSGESVDYTFDGWNITGMDNNTHTFGSRTSKKTEENNVKETEFKGLRYTSGGVIFNAMWIPPQITLPKINKGGYTCVWKSNGMGDKNSGGKYTPSAVGGATERTFTTSCSATKYTISLNKNGATNSPTASTTVTYGGTKLGKLATLPEKKYTVKFKKNYTGATISSSSLSSIAPFNGWYTKATSGTKVASKAATPVLVKSVSGYTNANGKWIKTTATTLYAGFGSQPSITLPTIKKTGYTCSWNTKSDGTGTTKNGGASYTPSKDITFYGICSVKTYPITLNKNGATNSPTTSTTVTYGGTRLGKLTTLPEKKYTVSFDKNGTGATATTTDLTSTAPFNGWYTKATSGTKVASNAVTPVLVKSVSGYTNADGKWIKTTATTLYAGFGSQPSITLPTIEKTGYTCSWNTNSDGSGTEKNGGASYTPSKDITFYGICSVKTYPITLNKNGATNSPTSSTTVTYGGKKLGKLTTLPEKEYTVSFNKNGTGATATTTDLTSTASFYGWYSAKSDGVKVASNAAIPVLVKSVSGYTNADGKWTKTAATTLYARFGSQPSITLPTIKKTGYTCSWNTKSDGRGTANNGGASYTPSKDITFYGRCSANKFTIEYRGNGSNGSMDDTSCTYDSDCPLRSNAFTRYGYTFLGWSTDKNATKATYTNKENVKNVITSGSLTLYAIWHKTIWAIDTPEGGADNLQAAFNKANSGAVLTLTKTYDDSYNYEMETKNNVTINLNGYTANMQNQIKIQSEHTISVNGGTLSSEHTVFNVNNGNLYISNGTYKTTGKTSHVVILSSGYVNVSNSTLSTNSANKHGVVWVGGGRANISNSTINNTATRTDNNHTPNCITLVDDGVVVLRGNTSLTSTYGQAIYVRMNNSGFLHILSGVKVSSNNNYSAVGFTSTSRGTFCKSPGAILSGDSQYSLNGANVSMPGVGSATCKNSGGY